MCEMGTQSTGAEGSLGDEQSTGKVPREAVTEEKGCGGQDPQRLSMWECQHTVLLG